MDSAKKGASEPSSCPGSVDIRRPKPVYQACPNCGREVELWTDEVKGVCGNCGHTAFMEDTPACFEWCEHAAECIGAEKYKELMSYKAAARGGPDPSGLLKEEHRLIERMLAALEKKVAAVEGGNKADCAFFERSIDFIRNFADRFHHGKEEDLLFKWLEERGIDRKAGPIGVMLEEHERGRVYVAGLAEACARLKAGDAAAYRDVVENARGYVLLLREHIEKEDSILYPLADKALSGPDKERLLAAFKEAEEKLGKDARAKYGKLLASLEKEAGE